MERLLSFQFLAYIVLLFILIHLRPLSSLENQWFSSCGKSFSCGNITGITYPFWGNDRPKECGYPGFELQCDDQGNTIIQISNIKYHVLDVNLDAKIIRVTRKELAVDGICQFNTTIDNSNTFEYASILVNFTMKYACPPWAGGVIPPPAGSFNCPISGMSYKNGFAIGGEKRVGTCHASIVVPARKEFSSGGVIGDLGYLKQLLEQGFDVRWKVDSNHCKECEKFGGRCGFDVGAKEFSCLCPDDKSSSSSSDYSCTTGVSPGTGNSKPLSSLATPSASGKNSHTPLALGLGLGGAALASFGIGFLIFFCRQKRKRIAAQASPNQTERKDLPILSSSNGLTSSSPSSTTFTRSTPSYPSSKSEADYGRGSSYFGAHVFSFAELEEATNNFDQSKELGDGGFGVVYYGKLHDGRLIAVKRLYENNFKRVEQFMNEVEILTRLRHKNLVTLYGCTSKRSRDLLLVYEYIPNGTVADHLHGNRAKSGLLSWPVRMNIAIETAEALAYLHSSVIIHRDVKTNNILLDNDFHVKVADFGLSRLFPDNVTHVSTAPQGTPGYVDPEYYQCYRLTEKSDVYSFGVVLIELISSLQAVDTNRHRHDINLANMAVNKIQGHSIHELVDPSLGFLTNSSVRRMTALVAELAFRCLQQERDLRPSMQEVLETLRGIQNGESKAHKPEVLDIVVDDVGLLMGSLSSPDSVSTGK